ncbi:MAG TPA: tripartite tricarboxylate transporter substrate binding protein [Xanthobacteraceae bacterium]|nr:tripartite tricarboxylate transporter substrate binding protein [Xanthobacteraceae bacterium]
MRLLTGLMAAVLALASTAAQSQDYPNKPIRIIVPFAPGGIVDTAARVVGQKLQERWGQQVIVDNRPGGNAFIGVTAAAKSPADGYTLLMAHTGEFAVNPAVFKDVPYDLDRDFTPITLINDAPMVFVVNANAPYKTMQELIAAAKAKPGTIGVSSPGNGSINHLVLEWLSLETGAKFLHVPYKGGAPAITATAGGEVPAGTAALGSAMPHIQAGRVRVIAVTTGERSSVNKDWPTLKESGVPNVQSSIWAGLFAPKGVPQPIIDKIYGEVAKILELPDVKARFAAGGGTTGGMKPAEFAAKIRQEATSLKQVAAKANVKVE